MPPPNFLKIFEIYLYKVFFITWPCGKRPYRLHCINTGCGRRTEPMMLSKKLADIVLSRRTQSAAPKQGRNTVRTRHRNSRYRFSHNTFTILARISSKESIDAEFEWILFGFSPGHIHSGRCNN